MKIELTNGQTRGIRSLVKAECANYSGDMCAILEDDCPQLTSASGLCSYFKESVLPLDSDLNHELTNTGFRLTCKKCGQAFTSDKYNTQYCDFCAKIITRDNKREYMRKKREGK